MATSPEKIKIIQESLNKQFNLTLVVDGVMGKKTAAAMLLVPVIPAHWNPERRLVGCIQYFCTMEGFDAGAIDGYWGPQTEQGYEELRLKLNGGQVLPWRTDEGVGGEAEDNSSPWPLQTQDELVKFYGQVGTNQTVITTPYPLKIAWKTEKVITKFSCHEKVADSVKRVLTRVVDHYGNRIPLLGLDLWGGCLNVRKMRGGNKWSTHSWGIAIDWDPVRNSLKMGKDKAQFAKPEYDMWWKLWEDEGWVSLGRSKNYDFMHVQAARVK